MRLVTKYGGSVHIDDELLPDKMKDWMWDDAKIVQDHLKVKKYWLATVQEKDFNSKVYEFKEEKVFEHQPTDEDLLYLLCKYAAFKTIVTVEEAYQVCEEDVIK